MKYYKILLRHSFGKRDNCFVFHCPSNCGYTRALEASGLYELPENYDTHDQSGKGDIYASEEIVSKFKEKVRLPIYGDKKEEHSGLNEFFVLPNTGQVRKELGVTTLDMLDIEQRENFSVYFRDEIFEEFKYIKEPNVYVCSLKENNPLTNEWFYYQDEEYETKSRDAAIFKFIKDRYLDDLAEEYKFKNEYEAKYNNDYNLNNKLVAKKYVSCKQKKKLVFDKWRKL